MNRYQCTLCDYIYDEAKGCTLTGIAPGTRFADLPDNWCCPECGAPKDAFELIVE